MYGVMHDALSLPKPRLLLLTISLPELCTLSATYMHPLCSLYTMTAPSLPPLRCPLPAPSLHPAAGAEGETRGGEVQGDQPADHDRAAEDGFAGTGA